MQVPQLFKLLGFLFYLLFLFNIMSLLFEVSIALSLLNIVEQKCREEGYPSVESVRVRIGRASGILPEAFTFAFDAAKKDTIAQEAKFIIDIVPLSGVCNECRSPFKLEEAHVFAFP
ncbi:MAG: hydrogenase maturation nickel metallochaperone HypA, partial [Deltaproteobacteria bacterium]|nr:hydrogenase maturation nickel metallochaperone HypA [Deltaproteobacteria bacterium]